MGTQTVDGASICPTRQPVVLGRNGGHSDVFAF